MAVLRNFPWKLARTLVLISILVCIGFFIAGPAAYPRYDGEHTLAAFSTSARQETDLERLAGSLARSVQQPIQPESIALWIRPQVNRQPAWPEKEI